MILELAFYPHDRVQSVSSLCRALGETEANLRRIIDNIPALYIGPTKKPKKNGTGFRDVYDTKAPLKPLLRRINTVFFKQVHYPNYLTGSLTGRDYVANVKMHAGQKIVISEDIAAFYDCITADHVRCIWNGFFRFSDEVADLLTALTTKDGRVYQGTPTSSYLANLAFWNKEGRVVERLLVRGIRYSRYVDDIMISSGSRLSRDQMDWAIRQLYGLIEGAQFTPKRAKHEVQTSGAKVTLMGLTANRRAGLSKQERSRIRTAVFQLEQQVASGDIDEQFVNRLNSTAAAVGRLRRLHPGDGVQLRDRVKKVRGIVVTTSN